VRRTWDASRQQPLVLLGTPASSKQYMVQGTMRKGGWGAAHLDASLQQPLALLPGCQLGLLRRRRRSRRFEIRAGQLLHTHRPAHQHKRKD